MDRHRIDIRPKFTLANDLGALPAPETPPHAPPGHLATVQRQLSQGEVLAAMQSLCSLLPMLASTKTVVSAYEELIAACVQQSLALGAAASNEAVLDHCRVLLCLAQIQPAIDAAFKTKVADMLQQVQSKLLAAHESAEEAKEACYCQVPSHTTHRTSETEARKIAAAAAAGPAAPVHGGDAIATPPRLHDLNTVGARHRVRRRAHAAAPARHSIPAQGRVFLEQCLVRRAADAFSRVRCIGRERERRISRVPPRPALC